MNLILHKTKIVEKDSKLADVLKSSHSGSLLSAMAARFEAILAAVPDIIMEVDQNKVYTWANQAGLEFFGTDVIGREAAYYFEGEQDTYDLVAPLFNGDGNVFYLESWQRRKDNAKRLLAWWCRALKNDQGLIIGAISTARDITEQREVEEKLYFQNKLFENTLESLSHPFYVIDVNDYTIKIANTAANIFGDILKPTKCCDLTNKHKSSCNRAPNACPLELVKKTKEPVKLEHVHYNKNGTVNYFEIHGFPILNDDGNVVQMIEYALDITERKQTEKELLKSELKWRSLTENSPDHILLLDCNAKILFINHTKPGISRDEIIGKSFYDYTGPKYQNVIQECFERVLRTGNPDKFETSYLDIDRKLYFFESFVGPVTEADKIIGFTVSSRDITMRKQIEQALKKSNDELESRVDKRTRELNHANKILRTEIAKYKKAEKARKVAERKLEQQRAISIRSDRLRSLGQMAAGIAHELNQPLVGVRGLAEHLLIGLDRGWELTEDKYREKLLLIIEQADRMSHIIQHVRLFARDASKPETHLVHVNDVIKSAMDMLGAQLHSRGILAKSDLCQNKCMIMANPFSLEEVFLNLMVNARDAIEERLKSDDNLTVPRILLRTYLKLKNSKEYVKILVIDNGIGIEEESLAQVYDPFFTTKDPDKGTGLGLAISKSIIEQFDGKIDIRSVYGQGTTIAITFPVRD